jgi:O-antigen/teichoic acid export membrane protein
MSDYGLLATLLLTIQVLISIMEFGATSAIMRFAGEYQRKDDMACLLGSSILMTIFSCFLVSILTISLSDVIFKTILDTENVRYYISLTCGAATAQALFMKVLAYYRAKGQGVRFTTASICAAVVLLFINWYFLVVIGQGIQGVLLSQIITYGLAWFTYTIYIGTTAGFSISIYTVRKLMVFGFPLVFAMVGHIAADTSAVYFLIYFNSPEEVAIFSLGHKIASITGIILILPFQLAYEPFVYANKDRPDIQKIISRLLTYLMLAFAFVSLGVVFVFRPLFPLIAPPEYAPAYEIIIWVFTGFAFLGFRAIGQSLLHIKNKTSITGTTITIYTVITIFLQYFLTQKIGLYAPVITFNFMNISIGVTLMILGLKQFPIPVDKARLLTISLLYLVFMYSGLLLWDKSGFLFYTLIPAVFLFGLFSLYAFGFFYRDEMAAIRSAIQSVITLGGHRNITKNGVPNRL